MSWIIYYILAVEHTALVMHDEGEMNLLRLSNTCMDLSLSHLIPLSRCKKE